MANVSKYSRKNVEEWHKKYNEFGKLRLVADCFSVSTSTVSQKFKKFGFSLGEKRKYSVDESFFNSETPEAFYWAGFIAADGCVYYTRKNKSSGFVAIILSNRDVETLYSFKKSIKFSGNIVKFKSHTTYGISNAARIQVSSVCMIKSLEKFGIYQNKTKTLKFPEWVCNHKYVNHFMRGYIDGDGSFFITQHSGRKHLNFSLCGTHDFLKTFREILIKECALKTNKICKSKGIFDLRYTGNVNVFKIRDFLYRDSHKLIRMDRKYKKAFDNGLFIKPRNQYKFRQVYGYEHKTGHLIFLDSMSDGNKLGFDGKGIQACCKGKKKDTQRLYLGVYK